MIVYCGTFPVEHFFSVSGSHDCFLLFVISFEETKWFIERKLLLPAMTSTCMQHQPKAEPTAQHEAKYYASKVIKARNTREFFSHMYV